MKIEILSIDGLSLAAEAWRLSRDADTQTEWSEICSVDSPHCEMPSAFCHFRGFTVLEREIFASSRTHVMWARTSFVDDPSRYVVPPDLSLRANKEFHAGVRTKMLAAKARGDSQDEWRRLLPISSETAFTMRLSYRDAIKYAKYFRYLSTKPEVSSALHSRFAASALCLMGLVDSFTGSSDASKEAADAMGLAKFLYEIKVHRHQPVEEGGVIVAAFDVPLWMRAHFVRHRPITLVDDLFQVLCREDVLDLSISHPMTVQVAASRDVWSSLLGKRSCWIAQSTLSAERDPWRDVIDEIGASALPCAGGTCAYRRDALNRVEGTLDRGVPCPRFIRLEGIDPGPHLARIEAAAASRSPIWHKEIEVMRASPARQP